MADQDKDRTKTMTGKEGKPGGSSPDLLSGTQQRTDAVGASVDLSSTYGSPTGSSTDLGSGTSKPPPSMTDAKETGRRMVDEAKHAAQDLTGRAKIQGRSMFEQQKDSAATQVDSAAHAFRSTAAHLQEEGQSQTGRYVSMVAEQLESLGGQLRHKNLDTLLRDAEDLGRRSPGTFFAGSVIAGLLLSRFLKSSSQHRRAPMDMRQDGHPSRSSYATDRSGGTSTTASSTSGASDSTTSPTDSSTSAPGGNSYGNR